MECKNLEQFVSFQCFVRLFSWLHFGACSADCFLGHVLLATFGVMFCRCGSKWQCDSTHDHKQVVNRLKIPKGLSTLLFHRWSEVPSRGGVCIDSLYEKLPVLQGTHLSAFLKCCFLELLARPSSIRTLLHSDFHSLLEKLLALQRYRLSVFSECCLLEPSSVKTSS